LENCNGFALSAVDELNNQSSPTK